MDFAKSTLQCDLRACRKLHCEESQSLQDYPAAAPTPLFFFAFFSRWYFYLALLDHRISVSLSSIILSLQSILLVNITSPNKEKILWDKKILRALIREMQKCRRERMKDKEISGCEISVLVESNLSINGGLRSRAKENNLKNLQLSICPESLKINNNCRLFCFKNKKIKKN